ncbi:glutamate--tRNA ligase [Lichenifustis flavocetrariae]|uniref:Glutamate--tRNA ligase n=1 Tax=Lichenifustis flavocetrariae TaxID=2949735 RepID=A0AA41YZZ8_9HYPH|nr:glutamate--tRNA ligase [Lichenifustis flavocetrariae]MCW6508018.1 glutamate--tRNA ligase [Lichenifustis flavocetrariae]
MTAPIVRFAPSPTGRIHIGNARTALLNFLFASGQGGRFVLRFDDTDQERSRQEYADSIVVDLDWLGVVPDLVVRQSDRVAFYAAAVARLKASGRLYPAYESADELDRRRKRMQARGLPPIYDRAALKLTEDDRAKLEAEGRRPHWRFRLDSETVTWTDLVRGESHIDCASLSDPVLVREDGTYLYTLPSVVDDIELGITHVVRGEDHVTNTAVQVQLFRALGAEPPLFGHHNLLVNASGEGLSKRSGALSLTGLREAGAEPLAVAALAVLTGSAESVHPVAALADLGPVDLARLSRAPARFDEHDLWTLSAKTLHGLPFETVRPRFAARGLPDDAVGETFWLAVRGNLERFDDIDGWWAVVHGSIEPVGEDPELLAAATRLLPEEPWSSATWAAWTTRVKAETSRKGRALFHPLRLALTGRDTGPELAVLLPLIGRARVLARLSGHAGSSRQEP